MDAQQARGLSLQCGGCRTTDPPIQRLITGPSSFSVQWNDQELDYRGDRAYTGLSPSIHGHRGADCAGLNFLPRCRGSMNVQGLFVAGLLIAEALGLGLTSAILSTGKLFPQHHGHRIRLDIGL